MWEALGGYYELGELYFGSHTGNQHPGHPGSPGVGELLAAWRGHSGGPLQQPPTLESEGQPLQGTSENPIGSKHGLGRMCACKRAWKKQSIPLILDLGCQDRRRFPESLLFPAMCFCTTFSGMSVPRQLLKMQSCTFRVKQNISPLIS